MGTKRNYTTATLCTIIANNSSWQPHEVRKQTNQIKTQRAGGGTASSSDRLHTQTHSTQTAALLLYN